MIYTYLIISYVITLFMMRSLNNGIDRYPLKETAEDLYVMLFIWSLSPISWTIMTILYIRVWVVRPHPHIEKFLRIIFKTR